MFCLSKKSFVCRVAHRFDSQRRPASFGLRDSFAVEREDYEVHLARELRLDDDKM